LRAAFDVLVGFMVDKGEIALNLLGAGEIEGGAGHVAEQDGSLDNLAVGEPGRVGLAVDGRRRDSACLGLGCLGVSIWLRYQAMRVLRVNSPTAEPTATKAGRRFLTSILSKSVVDRC
jgi:hypothetical protein